MNWSTRAIHFGALSLFGMTLACGDGTGTGDAQLTVALTDAPSDYYASAEVDIGAIEILPVDGPPIVLTDAGGTYDLLTLQDGVTADLATLNIEPGTYVQLRMIVDGARVTLASGYEFTDGSTSRELIVPSGALTGIKINLSSADGDGSAGVEIVAGETILIVDFDVNQNFVIQGDPNTPAGIQGVLFTPLLRAVVRDVAGSITGVVTESGSGNPLESLVVRAQLSESTVLEALQTDEATASTQTDGSYIIRFLSPGTYDVSVDDFSAAVQSVTVGEAEAVEGVDFSGTSSP